MKVAAVEPLDFNKIKKVLTSNRITDAQKIDFVRKNRLEIKKIMEPHISSADFKNLMDSRPLLMFRPLKNSYTKAGDKIILAKSLGIKSSDVPSYIKNVTEALKDIDKLSFLPQERLDTIKTYVYRHGSKDEVVAFLNYELTKAKDTIKTLYHTLEYHNGGVADYFIRPIHRMDNNTMIRIYNVVDKHIKSLEKQGLLSEADSEKIGRQALIRIYQIQNNSKLINAIKTYKILS